ncbi:GNAT family N-acetyltransferase [Carbonactinospora thermoautotrophica]|uniref:bifunctional acetate--CoA ligase family protein/GNAT family N-acetyltransferase n=1 Tax=Carbonactinospora thermoautotrophica TaxID=1469144 RepID=UPI00227198FA|nr:GNAT family N-acetyltransferase [Carbonactinospora thermoautotrophica]MCX9192895.1 GNAT family N-acetyltransferase [Carbonactinospora thermoautotrophica]
MPGLQVGESDALTITGRVLRIRPVRAEDLPALRELNRRISDRSVFLRFFALNRLAADRYVEQLTDERDSAHRGVVGELDGRVVAVASLHRIGGEDRAEIGLLVDDDCQGEGIGTLLLEELAAAAAREGIRELVAETLAENAAVLRVFTDSGFAEDCRWEGGEALIRLRTAADPAFLEALDERERRAESASLAPLFRPRSVAVVGAGRAPGGVGHEALRSIVAGGFTGRLYAVNPHAAEIAGVPCFPDVTALPEAVDLVVIAVPAPSVTGVVTACGKAGTRVAVVLSSGFADAGPEGRRRQAELLAAARRYGMRLVGPNCLGVVVTDPEVSLNATFAPARLRPGQLALASQSGAVGMAVLDHAARVGLGLSSFVSLGNKADVSGNDLLLYWAGDERTRVIALYLESFGNPRKFARIARRLARVKPILTLTGGVTPTGGRAGRSHTAALASSDTALEALFAQAGVVRTRTLEELLEAARLFAEQPVPSGDRLAILGNAGGAGVLAADAAYLAGLTVPCLSEELRQRLTRALPAAPAVDNPIDLGAAAAPHQFAAALDLLLGSGEVDAVMVNVAATAATDPAGVARAVTEAHARHQNIPFAACVLGAADRPSGWAGQGGEIPVYEFPESAVRALAHAARYGRWLRRPPGRVHAWPVDLAPARRLVDGFLAAHPDGGWLGLADAIRLLACFGIEVVQTVRVSSAEEAVAVADRLGYPVAMKAAVPGRVHKTEYGGVRLGLGTAGEVRTAYQRLAAGLAGEPGTEIFVQPMVAAPIELIVGVTYERPFGPLVACGLGGVATEVLRDQVFRMPPLTDLDAAEMLRSLRSAPLLFGYRGAQGVNIGAVEELLQRVGQLAATLPEVTELDLNPVMAGPSGAVPVDVRVRVAPAPLDPEGRLRALTSVHR